MSLIGIHIDSTPNSLIDQIQYYHNKNCNTLQLFVSTNKKHKEFYEPIKKLINKLNIILSVHISYTINIASDPNNYSWGIMQFIEEIKVASEIGAYAVVVHLGKQLDLTKEVALNNMLINLLKVLDATMNLDIKILIETSTGQGTEMCYDLNEFASFFKKIKNNRIGICLDTCHIFNAGYDIRTKKTTEKYLMNFEDKIGINNIKLIHLNDSYNDLGMNIDRHQNIGKGYIGIEGIKQIIMFFTNLNIPIVLETPDEFINDDLAILSRYSIKPFSLNKI
jgi:deoxyribonuclease-4